MDVLYRFVQFSRIWRWCCSKTCITIYSTIDSDSYDTSMYTPTYSDQVMCSFEHCLDRNLNITADTHTVQLPPTILSTDLDINDQGNTNPLVLASIPDSVYTHINSIVLHPQYPCFEPIQSNQSGHHSSLFGSRFGVPFKDTHGSTFGRPLSG